MLQVRCIRGSVLPSLNSSARPSPSFPSSCRLPRPRPLFFDRGRPLSSLCSSFSSHPPSVLLCRSSRSSLRSLQLVGVRFASSLGTADLPEEAKAGSRRSPDGGEAEKDGGEAKAGEAAVKGGEVRAGERRLPSDVEVDSLRRMEGSAQLTKEDLQRLEAQPLPPRPTAPSAPSPPSAAPTATATASASTASPVSPVPPTVPLAAPASLTSSASLSSTASPTWFSKSRHPSSFSLPPAPPDSPLIRGVLWFDCVYPMQAHWLDPRHLLATHNHEQLIPSIMPQDVEIVSMIPRIKEGGVFVQFETRKGDHFAQAQDVADAVIRKLTKKPVRAFFTTRPVHCHLVKGEPFLEDLLSRFPSARLKIEVKGSAVATSEVTLEHLFGQLRTFGRINDLVLGPYVKEQPRQASVQFRKMYGAVGARNCIHRFAIPVVTSPPSPGPPSLAVLFFTYDSVLKTSYLIDFFNKHPRIMVPLIGLLFAAFTFLIFDPLRSFNIVNKVTGRFTIEGISSLGPLAWLRTQWTSLSKHRIFDVFKHGGEGTVVRSSWSAREADEEKVVKWLTSIPDRLLFITGAKGAGKQALVKQCTQHRKNVVEINFAQFIDRNDEEFGLSSALGFSPGFSLLTWVSSLMDIFTPGAGKASGAGTAQFSSQLQKILEVTTDALVTIDSKQQKRTAVKSNDEGQVVEEHKSNRGEALREKLISLTNSGEATSAPNAKKLQSGKQQERNSLGVVGGKEKGGERSAERTADAKDNGFINTDVIARKVEDSRAAAHDRSEYSDSIPLFIVDGFSPDNKDKHNNFMAAFVQFAAQMTSAQLARFLFLTDSTLEENISKSMPDIKVQEVSLSDADTSSAMKFVLNSVSSGQKAAMSEELRDETMSAVSILGGRYSDLLSLVRQLESGASPLEAAEEIVNQSIGIVKSLIFTDSKDVKWNRVQLWQTLSMLVDVNERSRKRGAAGLSTEKGGHILSPRDWLGYDDCLFNVFQGDDLALRGLVRADLLRIESRVNAQDRLRAGSPVLMEAFRRLRSSNKFSAGMDILVAKAMVEKEQKKIGEAEEELQRVSRLEGDFVDREGKAVAVYGKSRGSWWGESEEEKSRRVFKEEMARRRAYLLGLLHDSHGKVHKFDQQRREAEALVKQIQLDPHDVNYRDGT